MKVRRNIWLAIALCNLIAATALTSQRATPKPVVYIPYSDAKPVIQSLAEILPPELKGKSARAIEAAWPAWVAQHDGEVRARLAQGDEDSIVNLLLFGTSFTRRARLSLAQVKQLRIDPSGPPTDGPAATEVSRLIDARIEDFVASLRAPRRNDRLAFAAGVISSKGIRVNNPAGRAAAKQFLREQLQRIVKENESYARALEAARLQGNTTEEFATRSHLFSQRGLSSDTSLLPNFAIEQSLKQITARGVIARGSVRRVAVIGPGLDFTDKQEGYDFYPQQTIQPFAVIDSLLRLGLATADTLQVVTFDLSPRVNDHLRRARLRALNGVPYVVQLPREAQSGWTEEAIEYWQNFGDQIGAAVPPVSPPAGAGELKLRAVRIRPAVVALISPVDANIVLQRPDATAVDKFDLIVATNILVYYDNFEQSLAMQNIAHILQPGGLMLSNNAVLELPFFKVRSVGYSSIAYSDRPGDGDHVVWYRRSADP